MSFFFCEFEIKKKMTVEKKIDAKGEEKKQFVRTGCHKAEMISMANSPGVGVRSQSLTWN